MACHDLPMICVDAQGLGASRPNRPLFTDVSLTVSTGDRLAVVGINGCGKSTLLRALAGVEEPESGVVRFGRGARIGYLPQDPTVPAGTVRDVGGGAVRDVAGGAVRDVAGSAGAVHDAGGHWRTEAVLDRLDMGELLDADTVTLSGGQRKRVALARLLAGEYDLLVLDEPTNHLDLDAIAFLEGWLADFPGGLVLVTHDRHVLDRVTTQVLELDRGRAYLHVPRGEHAGSGYAAYLAGRIEREERASVAEDVRRNLARTELAWLRRGAPARTSKPKARIASATAIVEGRAQGAARSGALDLAALGTTRLGSKVVELHDVTFAWPETEAAGAPSPLVRHLDHVIEPGDRLGVVGSNGAGKTTLLELIADRLQPTSGRIERGSTLRIGYYDQHGVELDTTMRVRDAVAGPGNAPTHQHAALMERFWFDADAQWAQIGTLSGGERRRLQLLLVLADQPNVLLLDEPTNDLDLDTLRALEDFLEGWAGAMVVVSHDRTFLDRTVTEVLALDGRGGAALVRGGYAGWIAARAAGGAGGRVAATPSAAVGGRLPATPHPASKPVERAAGGRSPSTMRRMLSAAEREVAAAAAERDRLGGLLASGVTDHGELARLGHALADVEQRLATAEEHWLTLAAEAEASGLAT